MRLVPLCAAAVFLAAAQQPQNDPAKERTLVERLAGRIQKHEHDSPRKAGAAHVTIPNTLVAYDLVSIPAGEFEMGSSAKKDEQPVHRVRVDAFWMQAHEITWDEYRLFMFDTAEGVDAVTHPTRPYVEMS